MIVILQRWSVCIICGLKMKVSLKSKENDILTLMLIKRNDVLVEISTV